MISLFDKIIFFQISCQAFGNALFQTFRFHVDKLEENVRNMLLYLLLFSDDCKRAQDDDADYRADSRDLQPE